MRCVVAAAEGELLQNSPLLPATAAPETLGHVSLLGVQKLLTDGSYT